MKVNQDECIAENGTIKHVITGNTIKYGDLIGFASQLEFPRSPKTKSSNEYRIIGKKIQRLDTSSCIRRIIGSSQSRRNHVPKGC